MRNLIRGTGISTGFNVLVSLFFVIQLSLIEYLSILQESADTFSQKNEPSKFGNSFDYIIGKL